MNREKRDRRQARDERWRQAQKTGEYIDEFTHQPKQPIALSFLDALNQRLANRGEEPL